MQAKLRNLKNGTQTEYKFASEDRVERVSLEQHIAEYLYESGGRYTFMNTETYEQIELGADELGDAIGYLIPNNRIEIEFHDTTPLGVSLPKTVELKVVEAAPGIANATVSNVLKPAKTETGLVVGIAELHQRSDTIQRALPDRQLRRPREGNAPSRPARAFPPERARSLAHVLGPSSTDARSRRTSRTSPRGRFPARALQRGLLRRPGSTAASTFGDGLRPAPSADAIRSLRGLDLTFREPHAMRLRRRGSFAVSIMPIAILSGR
jgi:elongation factor P